MSRVVFGVGPVRELVRARASTVVALYVDASRTRKKGNDPAQALAADARNRGVSVEVVPRSTLDGLTGRDANHQGVVAVAGEMEYAELEDIIESALSHDRAPLLVALDGVQDPHNLGAIARSAYLFGADGLIIPRKRAVGVTPAATKSSAGATEVLPIAQVTNLVRALAELKRVGVWTVAIASAPTAQPLWRLDGTMPLCLVVGAEGAGIRPLVAKQCDFFADIPMHGAHVGSFNVSVATGMALYEVSRQRAQG